jgi:para-aminobenzoate synthetase/4-amino-4-deoxychorismate lyase
MPYSAVIYDAPIRRWLRFADPVEKVTANRPEQVLPALERLEAVTEKEGLHAVGFVAYEAAPGFDPACRVHSPGDFPLLWFGIYPAPEEIELPASPSPAALSWTPGLDAAGFGRAVAAIKEEIARGATYQVNFTFALRTAFEQDPWTFFATLAQGQQAGQAAYIDTGRFVVCCASPELFFEREGELLTARPMKGTARRGRTSGEDRLQAAGLSDSDKDRAENLMILDMLRNDLGRLGGEVRVPELFRLEKYPTLWQMTSTATTRSDASIAQIFAALFPCASITGAPKIRTMDIIADLEREPRRIYTGAVGHLAPGRRARFGVAIRTALVDRCAGSAEYRVGAGITWDSQAESEYRECLDKAGILKRPAPPFAVLETMRWTPGDGIWLQEEHLQRMAATAEYFGYAWGRDRVEARLRVLVRTLPPAAHKVRLLLHADGRLEATASRLTVAGAKPLSMQLARRPVDAEDPFLYHKTTRREVYERARAEAPGADEVLLWNHRGEVTEATTANLVVELDGRRLTPPVSSGLLAGTLRARLLATGEVVEDVVGMGDLQRAERIWLVNSVRGWREACLRTTAET